jgi:hypothetical protein
MPDMPLELQIAARLVSHESGEAQIGFCLSILVCLIQDNLDNPDLLARGFRPGKDEVETVVNFLTAIHNPNAPRKPKKVLQ